MVNYQNTLKKIYTFEGKGLHTGASIKMEIHPASPNTGILFKRIDIGDDVIIEAIADNVSHTERRTTIEKNGVSVATPEHLLATFVGLGIDNALVVLDAPEVPILDGSAKPYVDAFLKDGILQQNQPRQYYKIEKEIRYKDEETGSEIIVSPSDHFSIEVEIDFNSKVLGKQKAIFTEDTNFSKEIAPCRTFVFFHELEYLYQLGLIKGGDIENAIVILENEVAQEKLDKMAEDLNIEKVTRTPKGYLSNLNLRFENECARHKLLDVIGDFSLIGFPIKGTIFATKSGHKINTTVAKMIREAALKNK